MTDQELEQLCKTHGFGAHASVIRQCILPSVGFTLVPTESKYGCSKLGGDPLIPRSINWPTYDSRPKSRPLDFLMQVDLREVRKHDLAQLFPPTGLLTFFYDLQKQPWGYNPENLSFYRICYYPENADLGLRPAPKSNCSLRERSILFWPALSLPPTTYSSRAGARMIEAITGQKGGHLDDASNEAFEKLSEALFRAEAPISEGPHHQLGGHASNIQGDMQLEAQLVMNGLYCGDASGYKDPKRQTLEKNCEDWLLLLQLDSESDGEDMLMWGDLGMLYYWVLRTDLAHNDFSKSWMTLQCG